MIKSPTLDWWAVAPELVLSVAGIAVLLYAIFSDRIARNLAPATALAACVASFGIAFSQLNNDPRIGAWVGQVDSDSLANIVRMLAAGAGAATVLFSWKLRPSDNRAAEHYSLLLFAVAGMGLFGAAGSLMTLFIGLELFSIALYILCALEAEKMPSLESGLKYLIVGGLSSSFLLYGCSLVYGAAGSLTLSEIGAADNSALLRLGLAMLLVAMTFKAAAAPLHWWAPDVYDGAPTSMTAFMATATKAAALLALIRLVAIAFPELTNAWQPLVAGIAVASITVGNFGALVQTKMKRLLAYSSISHAGYLMIGVIAWQESGIAAVLYGLVVYSTMTLGAFALVIIRERATGAAVMIDDLRGSGWGSFAGGGVFGWVSGLAMAILMFSLAGIPPTGGFFAKLGLLQSGVEAGYAWLAVVAAVGSVVGLGYYLRIIVVMYMQDPAKAQKAAKGAPTRQLFLETFAAACAIGIFVLALDADRYLHRGEHTACELGVATACHEKGAHSPS